MYHRWGVRVHPSRVVLTASTSEAYSLLFKLLCNPGDTILVPSPSYPLFSQLSRLDAIHAQPFALDPNDNWRPDLGFLDSAMTTARAIVMVHPNNPTGSYIHPDDASAIASRCCETGCALIADEVFLPFELDGGPGANTSFARFGDCLTFTLGGLSKSVGLPQLKLAWIVVGGPEGLAGEAITRLEYITDAYLSVSGPVARAAPQVLAEAVSVREAIVSRCRGNLETARRRTAEAPAVDVPHIGGGWTLCLRFPAVIDEEDLALRLLEDHGVAVHPGFFFDLPFDGGLLLSLLPPEKTFRDGYRLILDAMTQHL
jgi:aspartate/methionine/tyrosine aminotransferase